MRRATIWNHDAPGTWLGTCSVRLRRRECRPDGPADGVRDGLRDHRRNCNGEKANWLIKAQYRSTILVCFTYLATVNPRVIDLPDTICRATFTIDVPQAAPSPSKPSSVPKGFV